MIGIDNDIDTNGVISCPSNGITIPEYIDGKTVVAIAPKAFKGCNGYGPIVLPSVVESIGAEAFADNIYATGLSVPKQGNLKEINESAFLRLGSGNSDAFVFYAPQYLDVIGKNAFNGSHIGEIYIC